MDLSEFTDRGYNLHSMSLMDVITFSAWYANDYSARHPEQITNIIGTVLELQTFLYSDGPIPQPEASNYFTGLELRDFVTELEGRI